MMIFAPCTAPIIFGMVLDVNAVRAAGALLFLAVFDACLAPTTTAHSRAREFSRFCFAMFRFLLLMFRKFVCTFFQRRTCFAHFFAHVLHIFPSLQYCRNSRCTFFAHFSHICLHMFCTIAHVLHIVFNVANFIAHFLLSTRVCQAGSLFLLWVGICDG